MDWWTSLVLDCQNARRHSPLVRLNPVKSEAILSRTGKSFDYLVRKKKMLLPSIEEIQLLSITAKPQGSV